MATKPEELESKKVVLQSLKYDLVPIADLTPHPKNPNKHSKAQIEEIKKQLINQGVRQGLVRSSLSGHIVAGCGRLQAFKELGFKKAPVATQDFEDGAHEFAFMVADNALQRQSKLDLGFIQESILDFGPDFDVEMLAIPGFSIGEPPIIPPVEVSGASEKMAVCPECNHRFEII